MKAVERRLQIFNIVKKNKHVDVNEMAKMFNVSSMTIRRDLARLENQGVVSTTYGGAILNEGVSSEPSFDMKSGLSQHHKMQIAYEASLLVNDGDSIFIDCGTTPFEMIKFLSNKKITIMTNSWKVISAIQDFSKIKVLLVPGIYDPISEGALSSSTISFLENYTVDKAFISTQGVDINRGVSVPTDNDAQVKMAIMKCAKNKILLADHTKFGHSYMAKHGLLSDFDIILTDEYIDQCLLKQMHEKHYNIVISRGLS